jgi:hypothetical protein
MTHENDRALSAELGRVLARADAAYAEWTSAQEDFFEAESEASAALHMDDSLRSFVQGAVAEGVDRVDMEARLRRRFPAACGESFFEAALNLSEPRQGAPRPGDQSPVTMTRENKREALTWLVNSGRKYQLPFTDGRFGVISLIGTESWTDYAQVVLQTMIADSLLNLEDKLDRILAQQEDSEVEDQTAP